MNNKTMIISDQQLIDKLANKHQVNLLGANIICTDEKPIGNGIFGCARCELINYFQFQEESGDNASP